MADGREGQRVARRAQAEREVLARVAAVVVAFAFCACAMTVGLIMFASTISPDACSGTVFDTSTCESARLRPSLLACTLVGAALVAASIVASALIVSPRPGRRPGPPVR